ncbi:hypothetical protein CJF42_13480 [Pseudoalteromonas sp. NBT06-2]|uniref:hypothetical protein n=1 Tax=Pseudoalteromonas sp. NBT06-2 TaxID=2025950 RepID=UPI000BA57BE0|nr:hypothetical protein [Pseudoalteromonas sp. NBT06-2]PAJ73878.1 hypothetical protein CJF42_13480 [Pseudoalteromonas sp. NBT06-2]
MKIWLIIQTLLFESSSIYLLRDSQFSWVEWIEYITLHGLAAASFTILCWLFLPVQFKRPVISAMAFIFIIVICMPVVGMLGLATTFIIGLYLPKPQHNKVWCSAEELTLPNSPSEINNLHYGAGALREIISFNSSADQRQQAVNAIRYLPEKEGVPLLKIALNDLTDDVRLLAYSSLEKIEFRLNETLDIHQKQYAVTPSAKKAHQIAQNYWELCYLGLADGPLKSHYLKQAREYLLKANKLDDLAKVNLLLGRIFLAENDPLNAVKPLEKALEAGLMMKQVAPYLAESAFMMNDYKKVRHYIAYLPEQQGGTLSEMREFWLAKKY